MSIAKGAIAKTKILEVRELVREDLEVLRRPRHVATTAVKLRDSHHMVARLIAAGFRFHEVAARTGYSLARIAQLNKTPAFVELVASYRNKHDKAYLQGLDDYYENVKLNSIKAERKLGDRLDDDEDEMSVRELIAISRDGADRIGYGKRQMNMNVNLDFAADLEKAIKRSGKQIEAVATVIPNHQQPPGRLEQPRLKRRA